LPQGMIHMTMNICYGTNPFVLRFIKLHSKQETSNDRITLIQHLNENDFKIYKIMILIIT